MESPSWLAELSYQFKRADTKEQNYTEVKYYMIIAEKLPTP